MNKFNKILTLLMIASIVYLIFSLFFVTYKKYYLPHRQLSGQLSVYGSISKIEKDYLEIRISEEESMNLFYNQSSKMISLANNSQIDFDLNKITLGDQVLISYDNKKKLIIYLTDLGKSTDLVNKINGKIISIDKDIIKIKTLDLAASRMLFKLNSEIKYFDKTEGNSTGKEIDLENFKINDNIEILASFDKEPLIKTINLVEIGPNSS